MSETVNPDDDNSGGIREINFETSTQKERMRKHGETNSYNSQNSVGNDSVFSGHTTITTVPNEASTSDNKVELRHPSEEVKNTKVRRLSTVVPPNTLNLQQPPGIQRSQSENKMLYDSAGNAYTLYSVNPEATRKTHRSVSYTPTPVLDTPTRRNENPELGRGVPMNQKRRHVSAVVSPQQQQLKTKRPISANSQQYIVEHPTITKINRQYSQASTPTRNGGNMVLQLMIPPSGMNNYEMNNNNYLNTITDGNNNKRRARYNSVEEPADIYMNSAYTNTAYSEDLDDIMGYKPAFSIAESVPRTNVSEDDSDCAPSSPIEKKEMFKKHITIILSTIYALLIVTIGFLLYISDAVLGNGLPAEYFSLYLVVVAFIYLIYLMWDVRTYMTRKAKYKDILANQNQTSEIECEHLPNGAMQLSVQIPEASAITKELPNHYCLNKGKHSGSFYLKIGAAGFCLGHLVHSGLLLGYQIVFLTSESEEFFECASVATLLVDILYPLYSFLLLFFLFKYSNVIINRHITVARFGFMHCIASSICFWLWTILRETIDALATKEKEAETETESLEDSVESNSRIMASEINFFFGEGASTALPLTAYSRRGAEKLLSVFNVQGRALRSGCYGGDDGLSVIYKNYSPYLYPFSVEFSILVVGVLFIIWQSIGNCREQSSSHSSSDPSSGESQHSGSNANACTSKDCESNKLAEDSDRHESNLVIHADCHAANKGLFSGIVAIMISLVSIILFMIAVNGNRKHVAVLVNSVTELILLSAMFLASIFAYKQICRLDINKHPVSLLDDLLLFICLPTFFIDAVLGILPAVDNGINALSLVEIILRIFQVLVQTPLINDGLRRCSNSKELRKEKPGRELITFLIVANVALWFTQVFQIKAHGLKDDRYGYYGAILWTVLGHLTIPLTMFYRFHSSVCLGDIWMHAYEKGGH